MAVGRFLTAASTFITLYFTLFLIGPREQSVPAAGLLSGAAGVGLLIGNFTGGWFGDRLGHRPVMLGGAAIGSVLLIAVPWLPVPLLVIALPLLSYAMATAGISEAAIAALTVPFGDRRPAVALARAAFNAGLVVGPPLGALLLTHSFTTMFVVQGAARLVILVITARLLAKRKYRSKLGPASGPGRWRAVLSDRAVVVLLAAAVLADLVYRQLFTTLPIVLTDHDQPVALYSGLVAAGALIQAGLEVPIVVRLRRRTAYPIIAAGYALIGVGFAMFSLATSSCSPSWRWL